MEKSQNLGMTPEALPSLIRSIDANEVVGFDDSVTKQNVSDFHFMDLRGNDIEISNGVLHHQKIHSISISMPPSPMEVNLQSTKRVFFRDNLKPFGNDNNAHEVKFHSQPIPTGFGFDKAAVATVKFDKLKDNRYNSFKTCSGRLERQFSILRGKLRNEPQANPPQNLEGETLPVARYFDALEGPELDTLKPSEEIILPNDMKWPFLLRYPISSFGICLGVSSQAIMWKHLASTSSTHFLNISLKVNLILWYISLLLFTLVASTYLLKLLFYFEAVRREYYHPIRVNFFFAPWIALLFLAMGVPSSVAKSLNQSLWYVLMTPIFCLEIKIYGQWISGGQRRLSKVANPSNHLSVVGNFVGALLGALMGLKEGPIFFFAVGLAHYMVLFVTLYQRLPTNETLPKELHPVFFLFVATPSVASMAWAEINESFDYGSKIAYFIALFLYLSLAVRVNFFRGFRFSLAWWAYTFPMTGAAMATIRYSNEVSNIITKALSVTLSTIATVTVTGLLVTTILHAFALGDLFPNDIAIAINDQKPKKQRKWYHRRTSSRDKDLYLKATNSNEKPVEVSVVSAEKPTDNLKPFGNDNNAHEVKFHSQPIPTGFGFDKAAVATVKFDKLKDNRYNSFKTCSGRLERQFSILRGKLRNEPQANPPQNLEGETLPVARYFDALEGPELDTLKPSEEIILPNDMKWPFLLRYPISSFGICLGVSSQAIMWKHLASTSSTHFLNISLKVNLILWYISLLLFTLVASTYLLKLLFYFEAVRREYYHPIRVNFFFAPWIALLFLAMGVPSSVAKSLNQSLWYVLMTPIFCLEIKIYGQWISGGQRRLSKVANPSNHLSVVGNFVGALLGALMGLKEGPIFFFAVGLAHYMVLFVTLYQRLPTNETLPKELHPVFFLFVATPSVASMAWAEINESFNYGSKIAYFIALFLYLSLAVRVNFFRGFRFSLAWWAYTFPMTGAAMATIRYSNEVSNIITKALSVTLSTIATVTVTGLLVTTILHAFALGDLFPNDIAIAINDQKPKKQRKWYHRRTSSRDKDLYLKATNSNVKPVEVSVVSAEKPILVNE